MGFWDRAANLQALRTANGDVNQAMDLLLGFLEPPQQQLELQQQQQAFWDQQCTPIAVQPHQQQPGEDGQGQGVQQPVVERSHSSLLFSSPGEGAEEPEQPGEGPEDQAAYQPQSPPQEGQGETRMPG